MTALSFDVATYVLLQHLNPTPAVNKVISDLTTVAPWFNAMSVLVGTFYRRYPMLEMKGLLNYLGNALLRRSTFDLFALRVRPTVCDGCCVFDVL